MSKTTTLSEDERKLVELYHDMLLQMGRAVQQRVESTDTLERTVVGDAIRVLQGRLEGVGLAWCVLHGEEDMDDSEDRLRSLAIRHA